MFVGSDINVGRADQFHQFLGRNKTVAEDHVSFNAEILGQLLQEVPVIGHLRGEGYVGE